MQLYAFLVCIHVAKLLRLPAHAILISYKFTEVEDAILEPLFFVADGAQAETVAGSIIGVLGLSVELALNTEDDAALAGYGSVTVVTVLEG